MTLEGLEMEDTCAKLGHLWDLMSVAETEDSAAKSMPRKSIQQSMEIPAPEALLFGMAVAGVRKSVLPTSR